MHLLLMSDSSLQRSKTSEQWTNFDKRANKDILHSTNKTKENIRN
jgi:hypothetical protein